MIPAFIFIILLLNLYKQYNYTGNYAKSYDQLIKSLIKEKNDKKTGTLFIKDLPNSGMLMQLDLENNYNTVDPLKEIFELNFEIKVIK